MISFDYLRGDRHHRLRSLLGAAVSRRLRAPAAAVCVSAILVITASIIEAARLKDAYHTLDLDKSQCAQSALRLSSAHIYSRRVAALVRLEDRIRMLRASGDAEATRLAEIANRLPQHAWLISATHDAESLVLDGRASNLSVLAATIEALSTQRETAALVRSHELARSGLLEYRLRIGSPGR